MAKATAKKRKVGHEAEEDGSAWLSLAALEAAGVVLLGFAALMTLALATHSQSDPLMRLAPVSNAAGVVGANLSGGMLWLLGWGSIIGVGAVTLLGGSLVLGRGISAMGARVWVGVALLTLAVATLPPLLAGLAPGRLGSQLGGQVGDWLASWEQLLLSGWGALLLNGILALVGLLGVTGISTGTALSALGSGAAWSGQIALRVIGSSARAVFSAFERFSATLDPLLRKSGQLRAAIRVWRERRVRRAQVEASHATEISGETVPQIEPSSVRLERRATASAGRRVASDEDPQIVDHVEQRVREQKPEQETFQFKDDEPLGPFQLPDYSIFGMAPEGTRNFDRESLLMNSRILEKKLSDFGVLGKVVRVHPGPVITMYEYEPAAGVKVNKIVGLSDDLAMALRAISIRIIAPLPGKSVVGIEIPNPARETVYLRSVLESEAFRKSESALTVAMGKDIFGNPKTSDLAKMPHLLVAGSTGTGKSVFLNTFLCSLLCRATPDELKLLLVDPKLLELSVYEGIPHLIADVVTNPKRAAAALKGIVRKMEERYLMMSSVQVRNVAQFNEKARQKLADGEETFQLKPRSEKDKEDGTPGEFMAWATMPYIVVVIDELADLMVMVAKDVEESLQRLAQMARAAGIHLVLATQRPSVDVLTGVIKANFPSRVSFQVSSATDSRTILDQKGGENLLGLGDMLFLPPHTALVERLHGSYVTEKEVVDLVEFLRSQGKPVFDDELARFTEETAEVSEPGGDTEVDEMFDQAVAIVAETRNASISYVQRRLKVGYNRAARIIEQMEMDGMVGPQMGTRPREVFMRDPNEE